MCEKCSPARMQLTHESIAEAYVVLAEEMAAPVARMFFSHTMKFMPTAALVRDISDTDLEVLHETVMAELDRSFTPQAIDDALIEINGLRQALKTARQVLSMNLIARYERGDAMPQEIRDALDASKKAHDAQHGGEQNQIVDALRETVERMGGTVEVLELNPMGFDKKAPAQQS